MRLFSLAIQKAATVNWIFMTEETRYDHEIWIYQTFIRNEKLTANLNNE